MEKINEQSLKSWGDDKEWNLFFNQYRPYLLKLAINYKLPSQDVEDVVQEVFISMAKQFQNQSFSSDKGAFHAWVTKFAKWRIVDSIRKTARKNKVITSGDDILMESQPDISQNLDKKFEIEHQKVIIKKALKNLKGSKKTKEYNIFYDFFIENMSKEDIIEKYRTNSNNIYLAKHRILKRLKEEVAKLSEKEYAG
jgi:RNA polymerase sigma factor (sigma-70 family)